jgi:hypothetical protein
MDHTNYEANYESKMARIHYLNRALDSVTDKLTDNTYSIREAVTEESRQHYIQARVELDREYKALYATIQEVVRSITQDQITDLRVEYGAIELRRDALIEKCEYRLEGLIEDLRVQMEMIAYQLKILED